MSALDWKYLKELRSNIDKFMGLCAERYVSPDKEYVLLEIGASENNKTAKDYFPKNVAIKTLDITPITKPDVIGDITKHNANIPDESFDFISLCEVLEHTREPWNAPKEINRLLKVGGCCFCTTPLNLFIHPPYPDCWRFTDYGLRELFKDFNIISLDKLVDATRPGLPIQYTMVAQRKE